MVEKRVIGTQFSLLPEERDNENIILSIQSHPEIANELKRYLKKEGPYKYCKMVQELESKTDDYCVSKYGYPKKAVSSLGNAVFLDFTTHTIDIETFLHKIKTVPNYALDGRVCG